MAPLVSSNVCAVSPAQPPPRPQLRPSPDPFAAGDLDDLSLLPPSMCQAGSWAAAQRAPSACCEAARDERKGDGIDIGQSWAAPRGPLPPEGKPATTAVPPRAPRLGARRPPFELDSIPALVLPESAAVGLPPLGAPPPPFELGSIPALARPESAAVGLQPVGARPHPIELDSIPALALPQSAAVGLQPIEFDHAQKPMAADLAFCRQHPSRRRLTSNSTMDPDEGEGDKDSVVSFTLDGLSDAGHNSDGDGHPDLEEWPKFTQEDLAIKASALPVVSPGKPGEGCREQAPFFLQSLSGSPCHSDWEASTLKAASSACSTRDNTPTKFSKHALSSSPGAASDAV